MRVLFFSLSIALVLCWCSSLIEPTYSFVVIPPSRGFRSRRTGQVDIARDATSGNKGDGDDNDKGSSSMDPLTKASWYAVEAFGKIFGSNDKDSRSSSSSTATTKMSISLDRPPSSIQETLERIKLDNQREYFLSYVQLGITRKSCAYCSGRASCLLTPFQLMFPSDLITQFLKSKTVARSTS